MPPAMGQPINVVEKPTSTPGIARFETNRSLTGMGHERYHSVDDVLAERPVDVLARRLFETGGVTEVHANGSVVTVHLTEGWTGARLLDVIRELYIFYSPTGNGSATADEPEATPPGSTDTGETSDSTVTGDSREPSESAETSDFAVTGATDEPPPAEADVEDSTATGDSDEPAPAEADVEDG
jgi:hypothetical protein